MGRLRPYLISLLNLNCQGDQRVELQQGTPMSVRGERQHELCDRNDGVATALAKRT